MASTTVVEARCGLFHLESLTLKTLMLFLTESVSLALIVALGALTAGVTFSGRLTSRALQDLYYPLAIFSSRAAGLSLSPHYRVSSEREGPEPPPLL